MMMRLEYTNAFYPFTYGVQGKAIAAPDLSILTRCQQQKQHLTNLHLRSKDMFKTCPVIECIGNEGKSKIYINAYGLRQSVYLRFKDGNTALDTAEITKIVVLFQQLRFDIVDAKMVIRHPLEMAAMGVKPFLKLYVGSTISWKKFRETLQTNLTLQSLFTSEVHGVGLGPDTLLFLNKGVHRQGYLFIPIKQMCLRRSASYIEYNVFYKDIDFKVGNIESDIIHDILKSRIREICIKNKNQQSDLTKYIFINKCNNITNIDTSITWSMMKKIYYYNIFSDIFDVTKEELLSCLFEYVYDKTKQNSKNAYKILEQSLSVIMLDILKCMEQVKRELKEQWKKHFTSTLSENQDLIIANKMKWLAFDIETDFKPHEKKIETITCISTVLFDHAECLPEYRIFLRTSPSRNNDSKKQVYTVKKNKKDIITICQKQLLEKSVNQFIKNINFNFTESALEILLFDTEIDMIEAFLNYVRDNNINYLAGFNINKFDLPFLENRYNILKYCNRKQSVYKTRFDLSFTHRADEGYIQYVSYQKSQPSESRKRKFKEIDSDENSSDDDDDLEETYINDEILKFKNFRNIAGIYMSNVGIVDVMVLAGVPMRGCKLDDLCKQKFNLTKLHDTRVTYENLKNTWEYGDSDDLTVLSTYCLIDTILVFALILFEKYNSFFTAMSNITGLTQSELYRQRSVPQFLSLYYRLGYHLNIILPDSGISRDDSYMESDTFIYNNERDFQNICSPAGRTVENWGLFENFTAVFDFVSQYPSIMERNICMTSRISKDYVIKHNLIENVDYVKYTLRNVVTLKKHKKRKIDPFMVEQDVFFLTTQRYEALAKITSTLLKGERQVYKLKKAKAEKDENKDLIQLYDVQQRAVKVCCNMIYGNMSRLSPMVGATITYIARMDIENSARRLKDKYNVGVITGDTDSIFVPLVSCNCKTLSDVCQELFLPDCASLPSIGKALFARAAEYADLINKGDDDYSPVFPPPSKLCVEKIFWVLLLLRKKNYMGYKIESPNGKSILHLAGITGKKKGASFIKARTQFVCFKLIARNDFEGLIKFMEDLFEAVGAETRINEILELQKVELCKAGNVEGARNLLNQVEDQRKKMGGNIIPLTFLKGVEKVGDFNAQRLTVPTIQAKYDCLIKGITEDKAPMFIDIVRNSSVQVITFLELLCEILLISRKHDLSSTTKHSTAKKLTRLDITTMPSELIVSNNFRRQLSDDEYKKIAHFYNYLQTKRKSLDRERKDKFMPVVPKRGKKRELQTFRTLSQCDIDTLLFYIQNYSEEEETLPIYMFDDKYVVKSSDYFEDDKITIRSDQYRCVNIYKVCQNSNCRWVCIKGGATVQVISFNEPPSRNISFNNSLHKNIIYLKPTQKSWLPVNNIKLVEGTCIVIDIQDYSDDNITPYILETFSDYLVLKLSDHYV